MRFLNYITEKYLASEAKFGFELEAIYDDIELFPNILNVIEKMYINGGNIVSDSSISSPAYRTPFEYQSPVLSFTPNNIKLFKSFLYKLNKDRNFFINDSCGFHIHISYPNLTDVDAAWYICQLASDEKTLNKLLLFKNEIPFFETVYAGKNNLTSLRFDIKEYDWDNVFKKLTNVKYTAIRIHPQGTIEWRGPRNFLKNENIEYIDDFIKLLHFFIRDMSDKISSTSLNGLSKRDFIDSFRNYTIKKKEDNINFEPMKFGGKFNVNIENNIDKTSMYYNNKWIKDIEIVDIKEYTKPNTFSESTFDNGKLINNSDFIGCTLTNIQMIEKCNFESASITRGVFVNNSNLKYTNATSSSFNNTNFFKSSVNLCIIENNCEIIKSSSFDTTIENSEIENSEIIHSPRISNVNIYGSTLSDCKKVILDVKNIIDNSSLNSCIVNGEKNKSIINKCNIEKTIIEDAVLKDVTCNHSKFINCIIDNKNSSEFLSCTFKNCKFLDEHNKFEECKYE